MDSSDHNQDIEMEDATDSSYATYTDYSRMPTNSLLESQSRLAQRHQCATTLRHSTPGSHVSQQFPSSVDLGSAQLAQHIYGHRVHSPTCHGPTPMDMDSPTPRDQPRDEFSPIYINHATQLQNTMHNDQYTALDSPHELDEPESDHGSL